MHHKDTGEELTNILKKSLPEDTFNWYQDKISEIINDKSAKDLYLFYSLLRKKIPIDVNADTREVSVELDDFLRLKSINLLELSRIVVLIKILLADEDFFAPKVAKLIEVADTSELETFLKYLIFIPKAENYKKVGVEALRTNIETIFCAIALNNPYPSAYFNDQEWNQMYLKAAFMQLDLSNILDIEKRANKDLTRIISDYAHERWAASRQIDPFFWRPVSNYIEGDLLEDMKHLFQSKDSLENHAAALCCFYSNNSEAKALLDKYPNLKNNIANKSITWKNLKTAL